jgi:transposase
MDLKQANKVAEFVLEGSKIVIVMSNKAIFHLDNESEIANVEEYAKNNKLEMFIVKNDASKVEADKKETKKTK